MDKVDVIRQNVLIWTNIDDLQPGDIVPITREEQKQVRTGMTLQEILRKIAIEE